MIHLTGDLGPMASEVEYREVDSLPGYRVGSDGSVWTRMKSKRLGYRMGATWVLSDKWRPLNLISDSYGYLVVAIYINGQRKLKKVHRLVCEAFIGPCPQGMVCCHNDGIKTNNAVGNVRWGTHKDNASDRNRHGQWKVSRGADHVYAKLTEDDVIEIRRLATAGVITQKEIGERFGIVQTAVSNILLRRRWKHLEESA